MSPTKLAERARDGPGRGRGAWSPRTTLAYCWRSRAVAWLGAWLLVSPWLLGSGKDTTSTQNAIVAGATLIGAALWALMSRRPAQAHAVIVAVGVWLLLAPSLWYFGAAAATWSSIATGLAVIALSGSVLVTGPWTRPPLPERGRIDQEAEEVTQAHGWRTIPSPGGDGGVGGHRGRGRRGDRGTGDAARRLPASPRGGG